MKTSVIVGILALILAVALGVGAIWVAGQLQRYWDRDEMPEDR
jgi:hypothetical protein